MADGIKLGIDPELTASGKKDLKELAAQLDEMQKQLQEDLKLDVDTKDAQKNLSKLRKDTDGFIDEQKAALLALKRSGKEGSKAYQDILKSVKLANDEVQLLEKDLKDIDVEIGISVDTDQAAKELSDLSSLAKSAFSFEAAERAGEFLGGAAEGIGEFNEELRNLQARSGATGAELERLENSATNLFTQGVGDSISDAVKAIGFADQQLGEFLNPKELEDFTRTAAGISQVFETDINDVLGKSRTFIQNFGLAGDEAGSLISTLFRDASGAQDDVLDTLDEYSQLLVQTGFNAEESTALLIKGVQEGARDTDKLADSIKEAQIRLRAGDVSTALKDIKSPITDTIQGIVKAGEQGTISVKEVLQQTAASVENAFDQGQISESIRAQLQTAIAGTPAEDLGTELYGKIFSAPIDTSNIRAAGDEARAALEAAIAPTNAVDQALRSLEAFGTSALSAFQPAIAGGATLLTTISQVAPGITLLSQNFGALNAALGPVISSLLTKFLPGLAAQLGLTGSVTVATVAQTVATEAQAVATVTATGALRAMFAAMLTNPIFLVTAGLVGLGAVLFAIASGGETVAEALEGVNEQIDNTNTVLSETAKIDAQQDNLLKLADTYDRLENSTDPQSQAEFTAATNELAGALPEAVKGVGDLNSEMGANQDQTRINTDVVRSFANAQKDLNANIRAGAIEELLDEMEDLAEATRDAQEDVNDLTEEQAKYAAKVAELEASGKTYDNLGFSVDAYRSKLSSVTTELGEQSQAVLEGNEGLRRGIALARKGQTSWENIAEATELSVEEVKQYAKQMEAAEAAAKQAERGAEGLLVQTVSAADKTKGLAEEWDKTADSVSGAVDEMIKAIAFLILQARQASEEGFKLGNIFSDAFRQAQIGQLKSELREQIKLLNETDGILKDLKEEFGLVGTSSKKAADGTTELLVNLTDAYSTAVRETQKLRSEISETETELAGDLFKGIGIEFARQTKELRDDFEDEADKINESVAKERARLTDLLKDKKKATLEIKVELEDGSIIQGQEAVNALLERLDEQQSARLDQLRNERIQKERAAAQEIFDDRLQLIEQSIQEERAILSESLDFDVEFADETTVSGLEKLRDARIRILEEEQKDRIRALISETKDFKDGQAAIAKTFEDRVIAIQDALRAGSITEDQARAERLVEEEKAADELATLRQDIELKERADTTSRVTKIVEASGRRQENVYREIAEQIAELTKEFDPYLDALQSTTDTLIKTWEKYFDELDQLREEDLQNASDQREKDIVDLKKQLLDGQIVYEDYTRQLARIREQDTENASNETEAQESFLQGFGRLLSDVAVEQAKARGDALTLSDDFTNSMQVIEESASIATAGVVTALTGMAVEGGKQGREFLITMIDIFASLLDSVIPALIAVIWGESFAANPLTGGLLAAGITAVLLGLVAAAKSALIQGKSGGSRMEGGYAGDGRKDQEMGTYHGGEFIHTKEDTKRHRDLFEHIHKGGDPVEFLLNDLGQIGRDGAFSDPVDWMIAQNKRDLPKLAERIVNEIPTMRLVDDRAVPRILTNQDGSAINNREVVRELQTGFKGMSEGMEDLKTEFKGVKQQFKDSRAVQISGTSSVKGSHIETVYDKQKAGALSG